MLILGIFTLEGHRRGYNYISTYRPEADYDNSPIIRTLRRKNMKYSDHRKMLKKDNDMYKLSRQHTELMDKTILTLEVREKLDVVRKNFETKREELRLDFNKQMEAEIVKNIQTEIDILKEYATK